MKRDSAISSGLDAAQWSWFEEPEIVRSAIELRRAMKSSPAASAPAYAFLETVSAAADHETAKRAAPPWLPEVLRVLEERFESSLRFDAIAHDQGIHPVYLSRAFRRHTGVAMHDYVRSLRLRSARHLLSGSKRSVAAIAAQCGFSDSSHLCRTFSECLDMTPKSYRSLCREV
jgi:transcriptional regulator GlxA family with amidase domain